MATISFSAFVPECAVELPGCPEPSIINALRHSAIQLCRRSLAWVVTDEFDTEVDEAYYLLSLPSGTDLVMPLGIYLDGAKLPAVAIGVDALPVEVAGSGTPTGYSLSNDNELTLFPAPSSITGIVAKFAVCPSLTATNMDRMIGTEFFIPIASGAIAYLTATVGNAYSNPAISTYRRAIFDSGVMAAMNKAEKRGTTKSTFIKPRSFA